ncbi:MAG: NUDIX domain-containing protein [Saprospiraceae bacterium]|nr:NUDIX domain-containing protein [Saprospiraceae bacterium]MCB0543351.1 NUDIX domain-containing protein [Saprospiraceae bacterium]MCB0574730.1 NUDIX domain-containing protein [Saprospiraceae bacterium]MCB9308266.1 NUDIX domain-containing protein [Lewinellaceae bacterium]MCB9355395.1 NUDIX domain-containing protein [Lewinellaceae bacterium]
MLIFAVRLILEENGKMLFLRQTKKNGGRFSLIGGSVEEHEFAREALAREAEEEAGIHVEPSALSLVHVLHRHKLKKDETLIVLYFKASRFHGEPESLEPKKFKDVAWLQVNNLPAEVSKPTLHVLRCIRDNVIYSEFPARSKVLAFWEQFGNRWAGFSDF